MNRILFLLLALSPSVLPAQGPPPTPPSPPHLEKRISIHVLQRSLALTLEEIGQKGNFFFSYNSNILKGDSLVSLQRDSATVRQLLDLLLGENYTYIESGRYVILQTKAAAPPRSYTVSGWVVDAVTKKPISLASIYEADQLITTLTDTNGFFRLRLKDRSPKATITVSKDLYRDTFLVVPGGYDRELKLTITPEQVAELAAVFVSSRVERTWLGRMFLSSRQKIQSLNLLDFFASKPIQFSLIPGLGTHGQMGAQVINQLSLNLIGGYTAGSNGVELAGVFNIDKKDVKCFQAAGVFNLAGGNLRGVQLAGLYNQDLGSASGLQAAGLINNAADTLKGVQMAGLGNISRKKTIGFQIAGLFNYTRNLAGVQLGVINIADTSTGYMIGLLNLTKHGYHALSVYTSDLLPVNLSYKIGSRKTYSILLAGLDPRAGQRAYTLGFGIGANFFVAPKWTIATDITEQYYYPGNWKHQPIVYRLQPSLSWQCGKKIALFAGPSLSLYDPSHIEIAGGYRSPLPSHTFSVGGNRAWLGFSAGINFL